MTAQRLLSYRQRLSDNLFKEVVVWRLPRPVPGSQQPVQTLIIEVASDEEALAQAITAALSGIVRRSKPMRGA